MNLNNSSSRNSLIKIKFYDPNKQIIILELETKENTISVHDISLLVESKFQDEILFMSSKNSSFIPLMLSLNNQSNNLSVEHTHPPGEMFWGSDKWNAVRLLKSKWIS